MGDELAKERRISAPAIAEELLAPLGGMTAYFAWLELQVSFSIWLLIGGNTLEAQSIGRIVTADLSFRQLVNIFHALVLSQTGDEAEVANTVGELRARLFEAEQQRNTLTHSFWGAVPDRGESMRFKETIRSKGGWKFTSEQHSAADISKVALTFGALAYDVSHLALALIDREENESLGRE